jgi:aspartate racemase
VFGKAGIQISLPTPTDQEYIHDRYMNELVKGIILDETRTGLVQIAVKMKEQKGIDGLVLGGTELPPILRDADGIDVQILDTTKIHVIEIVAIMTAET